MLTQGRKIRFTEEEIRRHGQIGLDLGDVKSVDQLAREIEFWALTMAEVRPDIVEKLAKALKDREAAGTAGAEVPTAVPSAAIIPFR
ncbi:MAG: hypothetical protein E6R14_06455 [Thermomicrobiales bacterium]|nr:MAG: hypothetical protein E6R14_06455 [Thermomicrobiales bacterium]